MAELFDLYDPNEVEARTGGDFSPLPTGDYVMQLISSDWKETNPKPGKKPGKYIKLEFEVLDGEYAGRRYWENLNLVNTNDTAVKIAKQTLKQISESVGIFGALRDTQELHFKPLLAKVRLVPRKDNGVVVPGEFQNTARFAPLDGAATSAAPKVAASAPKPAAAAAAPKPWERHKRAS